LLQLVRAKDDVSDYWAELGKVQAAMGSYSDAYYAFTRAYELNRSDPGLVRALTELALRSGDLTQAQARAADLEILSPNDPWIKLVRGWSAFAELRYDDALSISDSMLATMPFDPSATALKARALSALQRDDEAIDLLNKQIQAQPTDAGSTALLAKMYYRRSDWAKSAQLAQRAGSLTPADTQNDLLLIETAFRSGNAELGRPASLELLGPNADPTTIASVIDLWADYWPSPQRIAEIRRLASTAAGPERRLLYAGYLNRFGSPADAMRVAAPMATLPVKADSAEANAIAGDELSRAGPAPAADRGFAASFRANGGAVRSPLRNIPPRHDGRRWRPHR